MNQLRHFSILVALFLLGCNGNPDPRASSAWESLPELDVARSESAAVVVEGSIYTMGGLVSTALGIGTTDSVERLLQGADAWEPVASLPEERHHAMSAAIDGRIYLIGGMDKTGFEPRREAWVLDGEAGWQSIAPLPEWIGAGAAVVHDGALYVVGGVDRGVALYSYDPESDIWISLPQMPTPREHTTAVSFRGQIWVLGGRWGANMHQSVDIYDPATDTWSKGPPMLEARSGFGATVIRDRIVVAGGEVFGPDRALNSVEEWDGADWIALPDLPVELHGMPLVTVADQVVVVGGSTQPGGVDNPGESWALTR